ncbi:MAG TPA: glucoamylase family protein [Gammaproteobacteria bacterium]|nr:glucoamylase family protein [Gammaproteobacteria bacterium]
MRWTERGFLRIAGLQSPPGGDSSPIRSELFSGERLAQHAESLAAAQHVGENVRGRGIHARLRDNERVLLDAYRSLSAAVANRQQIVSGGEWLLDNFHVVESQIEDIPDHMPSSYYRELPKLTDGFLAGFPRVYGIAWALVAHTDSLFSAEQITAFVRAYQRIAPLTIGELWAVAISLRLVLIENLRRLAEQIVCSQHGRRLADALVDRALAESVNPAEAFADAVLPAPPQRRAFVVQLTLRLRDPHPGSIPPMGFVDEWLASEGWTVDELVELEHAEQLAASLSIRNVITSLRAIAEFDWRGFVEAVSLVDATLARTPGYDALDFLTRNRYRNAVEELARHSGRKEWEIALEAQAAVEDAGTAPNQQAEVGYHLIGAGRAAFERRVGFRPTLRQRFRRLYVRNAAAAYLGTIALLTLLVLALAVYPALASGSGGYPLLLIGLVALLPASDIAVGFVNQAVTLLLPPRHLPRLELPAGVPADSRTMVVVPTMLRSVEDAEDQVVQLETHYLSNADGDVYFALLTDWSDADSEELPEDARVLATAIDGVRDLNARYEPGLAGPRFHLCHRRRLWNASQGCWMGWERKRGKLWEFTRLLRGAGETTFVSLSALPSVPAEVRYVITLDADTKLPLGAVRSLVATAMHPLNRPALDGDGHRVVAGYGILQPRVTPTLPRRTEHSVFHRVISRSGGMDPYAGAVSDVYQDLFGEGSYTGKGLYDVDAFRAAMADRVPENSVLSHDLLEGIYTRCALASDIEFFEEAPYHASVAASRSHRWIRGDWQLLPWILGSRGRDIPAIDRWKLFDNLRRSLSAPGAFGTILLAWMLPSTPQVAFLVFALFALSLPAILAVLGGLRRPRAVPLLDHLRAVRGDLLWGLGHSAVSVVLLGQRTWLTVDAVARTLWRLVVTHRHLLDWVTAAQQRDSASLTLGHFAVPLWGTTAGSLFAGALVFAFNPAGLRGIAGLLVVWWLAPVFALMVSRTPRPDPLEARSRVDAAELRAVARRTWRFFTTFVTADTHWLPPDNYQEDPEPVVAQRTSPTNIGLYLLSVVAARDFGWLGLLDALDRIEATLGTIERLPRLRGHLYNWYATDSLEPLEPRYISTVDSGNLAGHLLVLSQACRLAVDEGLDPATGIRGLADTHRLLELAVNALEPETSSTVTRNMLRDEVAACGSLLQRAGRDVIDWRTRYRRLCERAETLHDMAAAYLASADGPGGRDVEAWAGLLFADARSRLRDLEALFPNDAAVASADEPLATLAVRQWASTTDDGPPHCATAAAGELTRVNQRLLSLAERAEALSADMDFRFLYHHDRHLFALGFRVNDGELDTTCYDLLGSEARLTSLVAIARHSVSGAHWFHLGRRLTRAARGAVLLSWSGSMFEYLMPSLVCYTPRYSLLDQTCRRAVRRQIEYARERGVPWGISESAYNVRDLAFNYQYSAFGIPGLGMKRGLGQDLVVAPYATALAAMYYPRLAVENFVRLAQTGALGEHGYYEALDFTPSRLEKGQAVAVVRCYMAHHQGMSLVALDNAVHDGRMRHRFHSAPRIRAVELLLQERVPREVDTSRPLPGQARIEVARVPQPLPRREPSPSARQPVTHLLGNGHYAAMITAAGGGYSVCGDQAITRWREDGTRDCWGSFLYLRDRTTGSVWSAGYQPTRARPDEYEAVFLEDRVRIARRDGNVRSALEVVVSPEDDVEIRRLSLTNIGGDTVELEVTSYAEVVLAPLRADIAHPAFSGLFVRTEFLPQMRALMATRRRRDEREPERWAAHVVCGQGIAEGVQYESDRARFLGRGRSPASPAAVMNGAPLGNTVGAVLDPIFSLRVQVSVAAGATVHLSFSTMVGDSREAVEDLADKYHDPAAFKRASALAWTHTGMKLHHLRISHDDAQLYQEVANRLLFADALARATPATLARNHTDVTGLWKHGISGDRPIVLATVSHEEHRALVDALLSARDYLALKCLAFDLVILNEERSSYAQRFHEALGGAIDSSRRLAAPVGVDVGEGVFLLRRDLLSEDDVLLLQNAARIVLAGERGSLFQQLVGRRRPRRPRPAEPVADTDETSSPAAAVPHVDFFNGIGGMTADGREYVITLNPGQWTPAPWVNVIANASFGFIVSEAGAAFSWCGNSRENQLTPWFNDPVQDPTGEAFYLRDDDSGTVWTPTPLPVRLPMGRYLCRHGQGYTRFEHESHGIRSDLLQFVATEDPLKMSVLTLHNTSARRRRLTVTAYVEWALAASRSVSAPYVITEMDEATGTLFARNPWNTDFGRRVAFLHLCGQLTGWTADRKEFIGRNRDLASPAGLGRDARLGGRVGAALDPCGVQQTGVVLEPGQRVRIVALLGQGADRQQAETLVSHYRAAEPATVFDAVRRHWDEILETVEVSTPDPALDALVNRWLLYQTVSCRLLGRAGYYQVGGAFGFRDQLQDGMALVLSAPRQTRDHLLRAAGRQFPEGDVQHWWHPPSGRGVRTRFADDRVWLAYCATHYLRVTGDRTLLDESVPFIEGPPVEAGREDAHYQPETSGESATVYEHCARALDASLATGVHGLPLIGGGDWNDGMNHVGNGGAGESVWLAWFLIASLRPFADVAESRGDEERARRWREHASALAEAVEREGWDGAWYRRAFFDDGTPLGSATSPECRIDSIAQSRSVISGAAPQERARRAMDSVFEHLVRYGDELVLLFTPPFEHTHLDPGYIKGYPPGVRENGGQYTHAALWCVVACALLGEGDRAGDLLRLLNPLNRASTRTGAYAYKVEPYVVAADIYAEPPHARRGGWTWYTGAAGWFYRAAVEWVLGLRVEQDALTLDPCVPASWPGFRIRYRHGRHTEYVIEVLNPESVCSGIVQLHLDGEPVPHDAPIAMLRDGASHRVRVVLGRSPRSGQG